MAEPIAHAAESSMNGTIIAVVAGALVLLGLWLTAEGLFSNREGSDANGDVSSSDIDPRTLDWAKRRADGLE